LVFGLLAGNIVRFILSYVLQPYRPHLRLDLTKAGELFRFGKWILASSALVYFLNNGTSIVLGKLMTAAALGLYNMAARIASLPATEITAVVSQVTFPAYSKLQDNQEKLKVAYLRVLQVIALFSIPLAGGIFILATDFTRIILGEKWLSMVPALQLLALSGMIRSLSATTGPVFQGIGKPGIATKLQFVRLILTAILVYPLIRYLDIMGAALTVIISQLITDPVALYLAVKITGNGTKDIVKVFGLPLLSAAIMVLIIFIFKSYVFPSVGLAVFVSLVLLGVGVWLAMTYIYDRKLGYGIGLLVKKQWRALRGVPSKGDNI
jgi:lipopolysaccharide exporter